MAKTYTQEDLLNDLIKNGVQEESKNKGLEVCLVEVDDVEWSMTGPKAKFPFLEKWSEGQAILVIHIKVIDGEYKGCKFDVLTNLFTKSGKLNIYAGFESKDGEHVPASYLYEIIKLIKEHDEKQWDSTLFKPEKLVGKKFTLGIRQGKSKDGNIFYRGDFEKDRVKYEAWKKESQPKAEETGEAVDDETIDASSLPF